MRWWACSPSQTRMGKRTPWVSEQLRGRGRGEGNLPAGAEALQRGWWVKSGVSQHGLC